VTGQLEGLSFRIIVGLLTGFTLAIIFSLVTGLIVIVGHSTLPTRIGINLGDLFLLYVEGGVLGGVIYGLVEPAFRSLPSAILAGYLAVLPGVGLICYRIVPNLAGEEGPSWVLITALVSLKGAAAGAYGWFRWMRPKG